jgi:hypothetical protein
MRKQSRLNSSMFYLLPVAMLMMCSAGCDGLRLAPSEQQKQNAWLHNRTAAAAAETAKTEQSSQQLQALTQLSELQSRAFTAYCGLPQEYPPAETTGQILGESNRQLANAAVTESTARPDPWQVADSVLEFGLGVCGLLGGVCGTRAVQFLQGARTKSQALKEIIAGNELFKQQQPTQVEAFKAAQQNQSPETRQLVAALKA